MKKLLLLPLALSLSFCKCNKSTITKKNEFKTASNCPENGTCDLQIFKGKSLEIKTDDLGGVYYQLLENHNTSVIQYQYQRTTEEGLQDGQHREEIIFEINNASTVLNLKDKNLQEVKLLFGRHCYCKGQAGIFKIDSGSLILENKNNIITFELNFKTTKVPQLYEKVKATIR